MYFIDLQKIWGVYTYALQTSDISLYWFSATGKSVYRLSSVNKNQHIFRHLIGWAVVLTKSMSVYTKDPKTNQQWKLQTEP